jgi:[acyl-carrier-protein] S-malonyltransferase
VFAEPMNDPEMIRQNLVMQVTGTVRWRESIAFMARKGVTRFVEIGAGRVLAGLVKRIAENASAVSVGTPADVEGYLQSAAGRQQ